MIAPAGVTVEAQVPLTPCRARASFRAMS